MNKGYIEATHEDATVEQPISTDVRIHYLFSPGRPAVMYLRNGDPGYPSEPDEAELDFVERKIEDGWVRLDSTDPLFAWAETYLNENLDDVAEDDAGHLEDAREQARDLRDDV